MFYEQDAVENNLKCPNCNKKFDVPKIIPCGQTICLTCVSQFTSSNGEIFKCKFCNNLHQVPQNGFPTLKIIENLLLVQPVKVFRGALFLRLGEKLNQLKVKIDETQELTDTSESLIKTHCDLVRDEVTINFDSIQMELDKIRDKHLEEIDEFERNSLEMMNTEKDELQNLLEECKARHSEWYNEYKKPHLSKYHITNMLRNSDELIAKLLNIKSDFEGFLKAAQFITYAPCKKKIDENLVGTIIYDEKAPESDDDDDDDASEKICSCARNQVGVEENGHEEENFDPDQDYFDYMD